MAVDGGTEMAPEVKERLHRLVDALPAGELRAAERYLEFLTGVGHPFVRALLNAPEAAEPLSEGDREALAEGRRALEAGDVLSDSDLRAELGI